MGKRLINLSNVKVYYAVYTVHQLQPETTEGVTMLYRPLFLCRKLFIFYSRACNLLMLDCNIPYIR